MLALAGLELDLGVGLLAGLLDPGCGIVDGAVPQCLGGWAPGWLAACFCSFMECLEAWSWTWDLAVDE